MSTQAHESMISLYDSLWTTAEEAFARGELRLDPCLKAKNSDPRRGLTLILRPGPKVTGRIALCLKELRDFEPDQYIYPSSDFHVTVLSLLTATPDYVTNREKLASTIDAIKAAVAGMPPLKIEFRGLTATPDAVMVQGFPEDDALNRLRIRILDEMTARQIPVRQRYTPQSAHMTVLRYRRPCCDLAAWGRKLRSLRNRPLGSSCIGEIELVENDWYMSREKLTLLKTYPLDR